MRRALVGLAHQPGAVPLDVSRFLLERLRDRDNPDRLGRTCGGRVGVLLMVGTGGAGWDFWFSGAASGFLLAMIRPFRSVVFEPFVEVSLGNPERTARAELERG